MAVVAEAAVDLLALLELPVEVVVAVPVVEDMLLDQHPRLGQPIPVAVVVAPPYRELTGRLGQADLVS